MISIIICSREKTRASQLKKNIQDTIGTEFETIIIDNSENKHSITQAYNIGIDQSKFDYLCFIHEDIEFKTSNWGNILTSHIDKNPQGIVGVAGGIFNPIYINRITDYAVLKYRRRFLTSKVSSRPSSL